MKKIIKNLSMFFALVFIIPLVCIAQISCSSNNNSTTVEVSQTSDGSTGTTVVEDIEEDVVDIDGFYSFPFTSEITLRNVYLTDNTTAFEFFGVAQGDKNSLYTILDKALNIEEFFEELRLKAYKYETFDELTKQSSYVFENGFYNLVSEEYIELDEYYTYTSEDGMIVFVFDESSNIVSVYYQFTYEDEDGTVVETPVYVRVDYTRA